MHHLQSIACTSMARATGAGEPRRQAPIFLESAPWPMNSRYMCSKFWTLPVANTMLCERAIAADWRWACGIGRPRVKRAITLPHRPKLHVGRVVALGRRNLRASFRSSLRTLIEITFPTSSWTQFVVPVAVELVPTLGNLPGSSGATARSRPTPEHLLHTQWHATPWPPISDDLAHRETLQPQRTSQRLSLRARDCVSWVE